MTALRVLSSSYSGLTTKALLRPLNFVYTKLHTSTSHDQKNERSVLFNPIVDDQAQSWQASKSVPLVKLPSAYARLTKFKLSGNDIMDFIMLLLTRRPCALLP
eukprot:TRINITY_DN10663_c0_g1_i5.p3 TRINITY_DN10663_c0_g1~~TRINITY_DN10663_c0_g1_i5.p3  ORF type:complete len:103 (+),score=14.03 TRINITY_DN10663_c0_g1_i5:967-1275(+)